MPRSGEEARHRLQEAALELYRERGYDQVTTAEIAARAGVTERTYFRHFPDKREVLFRDEATFLDRMAQGVADAPAGASPLDALFHAYRGVTEMVVNNLPFTGPRQEVIMVTPALRERALAKSAAVIEVLTEGLKRRGTPDRLARLAAQIGAAAASQATANWRDDQSLTLDAHFVGAFEDLKALILTPVTD